MTARFIVGDALSVLQSMPDASVDLVLSSPPFLALRSYLPADHSDKAKELGSEPTPGAYIDSLLDIVEECRRVLTPHGSLAIELGDTYSGSGGAGGDYTEDGLRAAQPAFRGSAYAKRYEGVNGRSGPGRSRAVREGWPLDKSLCLVPELMRVAMVYGFNPLTGRETERWRARNVVRWCRPNPPVGALGDKFRPATSEMVVACVGDRRYFDLDAVRVPFTGHGSVEGTKRKVPDPERTLSNKENGLATRKNTHDGAPPLDWWEVSTEAYPGSHYATWPRKLLVRPIDAMCPRQVCTVCGKPSERVVDAEVLADGKPSPGTLNGRSAVEPWREASATHQAGRATFSRVATTVGWTDCGHDSWRPGVVLDPFAGSGTTLAVATGHNRDAVGIDLDARNADLALERVGMFLTVEHYAAEAV